MRIVSWNVNGIRASVKKGFCDKFKQFDADIVGLQETKATVEQTKEACSALDGYHFFGNAAKKAGYSGVALFSKKVPHKVVTTLGDERFDNEGRVVAAYFDDFLLVNAYFPNGSGKQSDNSRVPYKLEFYDALFDFLKSYDGPKFIMGDFNTAHHEIDLARPKENSKISGFLPVERQHFSSILSRGYIDTFRHFNQEPEHYTWWNMRFKARERNIGWRIDGVLACTNALPLVKKSFIWPEVHGSDHCPVGIELNLKNDASVLPE